MGSQAILVAGADPLGLAVVERLAQAGADIIALVSAGEASSHRLELERLGARVVVGSTRSAGELLGAGIGAVAAVVLTTNDDSENVDAALAARRLRPDLPLIVRLFDEPLGTYLRDTLAGVAILSMSAVSGPAFAELALRAVMTSVASKAPSRRRPRSARRRFAMDRVVVTTGLSAILLIVATTFYFAWALDLRPIDPRRPGPSGRGRRA